MTGKDGGPGAPRPSALHRPTVVSTTPVYDGRIVALRVDEVTLGNGATASREIVEHPGAVVVIAIDSEDRVFLVEQYRHAAGTTLLELPAGTLEPGEEPLATARRELREEVGLLAEQWEQLGTFYSSPGFCTEMLHVFLARGLTGTERDLDDDEELEVVLVPRRDLESGCEPLRDAKSLAALHLLGRLDSAHGNQH